MSSAATVNVAAVSPGIFIMDQTTQSGRRTARELFPGQPHESGASGRDVTDLLHWSRCATSYSAVRETPSPAANTVAQPTIGFGNQTGTVTYSGLAPGFAGLYQVNVVVPAGLAAGNQNLQITINGISSNIATVAITQ